MRIGQGYDVHRLVDGRKLILGGVRVPFERGLLGHSDADVLTHAIMDALLGAAGLRDIGEHFKDKDPRYDGANSLYLLELVMNMLDEAGWAVENVDSTIVAERPKLNVYVQQMRDNLAKVMRVDTSQVSVKATTEEKLGFTGAEKGIAAHAVALLCPKVY